MWELIIDGAIDGKSNMTIDAALFEEVACSSTSRTIVRFYQWSRPTLSLGRNQKIDKAVDTDYCAAYGIDVVHRPTGGRAVLHDDELTYAVISNDSSYFGDTIYGNSKAVSEALVGGYNAMAVTAVLTPETKKDSTLAHVAALLCFMSQSGYELTVDD